MLVSLTPVVALGDFLKCTGKGVIPILGRLGQVLSYPVRWESSRRPFGGGCLLSFWKWSQHRKPLHPLQSLERKLFVCACGNDLCAWYGVHRTMSRGNADSMMPFCLEPPLTVLFPLHVPGQGCAWPCLWALLLTCSPITGRLYSSCKAILLSMPLPAIYPRWVHMAMKDLELSWSLLGLLRTRVSKDIPFFLFLKDPFSAIHKSQVALRLPFRIIAFLKLHERIQYIHLLDQVPATRSKLTWLFLTWPAVKF